MTRAVLLLAAMGCTGCEALNLQPLDRVPVRESVYDLSPPQNAATEPSEPHTLPDHDDGTVPFYQLRKWLGE